MRRSAILLLLAGVSLFGYVRENTCYEENQCADNPPVPLQRVDNAAIQFYLNSEIVPGMQSSASGKSVTVISGDSDPVAAAAGAIAAWNGVSSANVHFLPVLPTSAGHDPIDGMMVISVASSAGDISVIGGAVAVTVVSWTSNPANLTNGQLLSCASTTDCMFPADGDIVDSDILLNPAISFSTNGTTSIDLQGVLTHELGHSLGANHTDVLGATMFQYASLSGRFPSMDDIAFVESAYPSSSNPAAMGTISGKITNSTGAIVPYALLDFVDSADGFVLGGISAADGTYSIQVPAGTYIVYAEPYTTLIQPANLYFTAAQAALTQSFQPSFLGSASSPTLVAVTAKSASTANLTVGAGGTAPALPFYGFGAAGAGGDVLTVSQVTGPAEIASGQTVDFAFIGAGFDSTTTVAVYGPGISAGPVRVDSSATYGGSLAGLPLLRTTLTISARTSPAVASILLTRGRSTLALSGFFVIGPVKPTFTSGAVLNDDNDPKTAGTVAPGEIVSIYGTNSGPACAYPSCPPYSFSSTYILTKDLANTRVLFDGIPAPLLYASAGQINAIVPYEVAGKASTQMQLEYEGIQSAAVAIPVVTTAPGILAVTNLGGSGNVAGNPTARGGYITLWITGEGQTSPGGIDGLGQEGFNGTLRNPAASISATVGGVQASTVQTEVDISGLLQMNVQIPASLSQTGGVPLVLTIGGATARGEGGAAVTVYVK